MHLILSRSSVIRQPAHYRARNDFNAAHVIIKLQFHYYIEI